MRQVRSDDCGSFGSQEDEDGNERRDDGEGDSFQRMICGEIGGEMSDGGHAGKWVYCARKLSLGG